MKAFTRSAGVASLVLGLALSLPVAADEYEHMQPRQGMHYGPGMMQGYGQGMMQGYGPMMGYGPGMMHGGPMMGYGMGMMYGGPMMGGMGMGGMGYGGMGMMPYPMMGGQWGSGAGFGLQLDDDQQQKMAQIREKFWKFQQEHMQEMWEQHSEMQKLWLDGAADSDKLLDAYREMQKDQLEMLEERLKLKKEMDAVLTDEQREQLKQMWRGMYRGG